MGLRGSLRKPQKVQSPTKYDSYFLLEDSWDGVRPVLEAQVSVLMKDEANAEALQVRRVTSTPASPPLAISRTRMYSEQS
jgi:hypothetical protein